MHAQACDPRQDQQGCAAVQQMRCDNYSAIVTKSTICRSLPWHSRIATICSNAMCTAVQLMSDSGFLLISNTCRFLVCYFSHQLETRCNLFTTHLDCRTPVSTLQPLLGSTLLLDCAKTVRNQHCCLESLVMPQLPLSSTKAVYLGPLSVLYNHFRDPIFCLIVPTL
jgi:hypothetical protein